MLLKPENTLMMKPCCIILQTHSILQGERVPALTAYGAALELKPGDPDFRANRALLLGEMGLDEIDYGAAEYILWFPLFLLGLKKLWYLVLAVLILSLTFAALHLYKKRDLFRSVSLTALFIAVLLAVSALTWESSSGRSAYVLSDDTALFKGDSPLYDTAAVLSAGTRRLRSWKNGRDGTGLKQRTEAGRKAG